MHVNKQTEGKGSANIVSGEGEPSEGKGKAATLRGERDPRVGLTEASDATKKEERNTALQGWGVELNKMATEARSTLKRPVHGRFNSKPQEQGSQQDRAHQPHKKTRKPDTCRHSG